MAGAVRVGEEGIASPAPGEMLARAGADWLAPVRERLATMQDRARLPHALLLLGQAGAGQSELALWLASRLLCDSAASVCGHCAACRLFLAGTHPDLQLIGIEPDASAIRVEQIRSLSATLSLHSYRGGAKVAVIDPADAMNINSFNALLKTLEEPRDNTFLILAAQRSDRLPRTIASRCARIRMPLPVRATALAWLNHREKRPNWERLLALANGAPFLALHYAAAGLEELDQQMQASVAEAEKGRLDVVATAAAWGSDQAEVRLFWLESWLAAGLRAASLPGDPINNNRLPWLRAAGDKRMIRAGYRLLDALREARLLVSGSLNSPLLFEGLLVSLLGLMSGDAGTEREFMD